MDWISDQDVLVVDRAQSNKPQAEDYQRFMEALRGGSLKHNGDQGSEDWIGYSFAQPRSVTRLVFQEGRHFPDGGAFVGAPQVQVQTTNAGVAVKWNTAQAKALFSAIQQDQPLTVPPAGTVPG